MAVINPSKPVLQNLFITPLEVYIAVNTTDCSVQQKFCFFLMNPVLIRTYFYIYVTVKGNAMILGHFESRAKLFSWIVFIHSCCPFEHMAKFYPCLFKHWSFWKKDCEKMIKGCSWINKCSFYPSSCFDLGWLFMDSTAVKWR